MLTLSSLINVIQGHDLSDYRVREIYLSLAGHFVRRTYNHLPDIWNFCQTFHCEMSGKYQIFRRSFCPARSNSFTGHFQNLPDMSGESGEFRVLWDYVITCRGICMEIEMKGFCCIDAYLVKSTSIMNTHERTWLFHCYKHANNHTLIPFHVSGVFWDPKRRSSSKF